MKKNGATHLGFILSFVIFIMFIVFMFSAIEPFLKTQASKQSLLDLLRFSVVENVKVEDLTIMTIEITFALDTSKECIKITGGEIHDIYNSGQELTIKDGEDNLLGYGDSGGNLVISPLPADNLLKIYYASNWNKGSPNYEGGSGCGTNNLGQSEYDIGFIKEEQTQILESNIFSLIDRYEADYEQLKIDLGIPEGSEFTFSFKLANETIIEPEGFSLPDTDIYASAFPLQYLDEEANFQIGFLTIKVW